MRRTAKACAFMLSVGIGACEASPGAPPAVGQEVGAVPLFGPRQDPPRYVGPTGSISDSFWVGEELPPATAAALHAALTSRLNGEPSVLEGLIGTIQSFDGTGGQSGVTVPCTSHRCSDGFTLLSSSPGHLVGSEMMHTILIDMEGKVVREWPLLPFPAKMLPGGYVIGGATDGRAGHQEHGWLVMMDWCGTPVVGWPGIPGNEGGARWHHDFQREGNPVGYYAPGLDPLIWGGKTLVLAHDNPDPALTRGVSDLPLEDDSFYELDAGGNVVWEWHAWQHVDQMGFGEVARAAIRAIAVTGAGGSGTDWQHVNALSYVGPNGFFDRGDLRFHPDNVIWSGRSSNIVAIVARHDHPNGSWKSGDIVWKVGPNFTPGNPEFRLGQIIGQHHAHMIPRGLPGAGNILVFDNGGLAGFGPLLPGLPPYWPNKYRDYSRVIEFNPQTLEIAWEYRLAKPAAGERKFFSWFVSSAQRLFNGNTLVTEGKDGRVFEVTPDKEIVWEYVSPFVGLPSQGLGNLLYRAYRVPWQWLPARLQCP